MLMRALVMFCVALSCVTAAARAAAQAPARGARPATPQRSPAPRERTPAQQVRDEWNRGAIAYRTGKFAEAQKHFERVRELDPKFKDVRLYIARSIERQYQPGDMSQENVAKGQEAVAAYEALLADDPVNDDVFRGLVNLLTQMRNPDAVREAVLRRANDVSVPVEKRVGAIMSLATADMKCAVEVTERKENKESVEQSGKVTLKYKMPADTGEFYRAQQCAMNGLNFVDHALQLAPENTRTLTTRAGFLRELSKLAEMEGNPGQKDFYDAQYAEVSQRLRALGVQLPPAVVQTPAPANAAAQGAGDAGATGKAVSGGVLTNKAVYAPAPEYPDTARAARATGAVVVQVTVNEDGTVESAQAVSGHPLLQQAAVNAVRNWRFSPTMLSGQPVKVTGTVTVNFTLE